MGQMWFYLGRRNNVSLCQKDIFSHIPNLPHRNGIAVCENTSELTMSSNIDNYSSNNNN